MKPLSVWLWDDFYLRFSAADYAPETPADRFAHLTNNSVTKYSGDFGNERFKGLMWAKRDFDAFLEAAGEGGRREALRGQIREIVRETLLAGSAKFGGRRNSFVVLGFDLMVDADFRVWLIEVNAAPSMELSTVG